MTVFIDDMFSSRLGRFGRMKMSHMVGTDENELHDMAARIGVKRKWYQGDHYDVCKEAREKAIKLGAVPITMRQMGMMSLYRSRFKTTGFPPPEVAEKWWAEKKKEIDGPNNE